MSEYQRYEFMTSDQPLTSAQLSEVRGLSSHIEVSSTHAVIEYHGGDFKYDPLDVLYKYFDGFLYWANWGSLQLALRFPHDVLPANLLDDYHFDKDIVAFTKHRKYDILTINFAEMEPPDGWVDYELEPLMNLRNELMDGDLRPLYILWLAQQELLADSYDDTEEENTPPPVPPSFNKLTAAQEALADLFYVPSEILAAAALHSRPASSSNHRDDFASWLKKLPPERGQDYLLRLAHNEPGLSRKLVTELRALHTTQSRESTPAGERVSYATLLKESQTIQAEEERQEQER